MTLPVGNILAIDVETTGRDPFSSKLLGVGLAVSPTEAVYTKDYALIQSYLSLPVTKIGHNIKFDVEVLESHGFTVAGKLEDTYVLAKVIGQWNKYGLKYLYQQIFNKPLPTVKDLINKYKPNKGKKGEVTDIPEEVLAEYCKKDCFMTLELYTYFKSIVHHNALKVYEDIELPLIRILIAMEQEGVKVEKKLLEAILDKNSSTLATMRALIWEFAGEEFNINSFPQLNRILYEKFKYPVVRRTKKTKEPQTNEESLIKLSKMNCPMAKMLVPYRKLEKIRSAFGYTLIESISQATNRIHPCFNQIEARTGRFSCESPNLQQIPQEIRMAFVPREGCTFVSADYSQMEMVMLAHLTKDEGLIKVFTEGRDIHEEVEKSLNVDRRTAKAINFGIAYGQGAFGLSKTIGCPSTKAKEYLETYNSLYPGIGEFTEQMVESVKQIGGVFTIFNRFRNIDAEEFNTQRLRSIAINTPIQGSCADIMKVAMKNIALDMAGLKSKLILQIHDELVVECLIEEKEQVKSILKNRMENVITMLAPLKVDIHEAMAWGLLK